MKHFINDNGQQTVVDLRTQQNTMEAQLRIFKQRCQDAILAAAPEHDQRNAALGLLTMDEAEAIRQAVEGPRERYRALKAQMLGMLAEGASVEQIEALRWEEA